MSLIHNGTQLNLFFLPVWQLHLEEHAQEVLLVDLLFKGRYTITLQARAQCLTKGSFKLR